jgi:hypothetical protein
MFRPILLVVLALSVVCPMPLSGGALDHGGSPHAQHSSAAPCGGCAGPAPSTGQVFELIPLAPSTTLVLTVPHLPLVHRLFHPPRPA